MRILHVHREFEPASSGVARHIDGLARACARAGHAVMVYAPRIKADGTSCPSCRTGLFARIRAADIVHVHAARSILALGATILARLCDRPVVYTPHCYYDQGGVLKRLAKGLWDRTAERLIYALARSVILLDEAWRVDVGGRGLGGDHIRIVPNCIDHEAIMARRPPMVTRIAGAPSLIHIGRLAAVKRLEDAIRALAEPGLEAAVLHLVGKGPEEIGLRALVEEIGVAQRVIFHGWLDDAATVTLLVGSDLSLLPSATEGLPTALLEALLLGVPVVASDIAGNRAILDPVGLNATHRVGDPADLARAVREWQALGLPEEVPHKVVALFSWASRAGDILALYGAPPPKPETEGDKE